MRTSCRIILFFQALFCSYSINAQTTFNNRFVVSNLSEGHAIIETDLGLEIVSVGSNGINFLTCTFSLDDQGLVADTLCYGADEVFSFGFIPSNEGVSLLADKLLTVNSFIYPENLGGNAYLIFNPLGEIEREKRWISPFYDEALGSASALAISRDGILIQQGKIFIAYEGSANQEETLIDAGVISFDENDEMVWERQWVTENIERPNAITYHEENLYVIIEEHPTNLLEDNIIYLYKLHPDNGDTEDEWNEPWGFNFTEAKEMISVEDGIVIVGSVLQEPGELTDACVLKINADGEELWHTIIENPDTTYRRSFTEVVQTADGNYVAAGEWKYRLTEFDEENGNFNDDGWLVKFDAQTGSILWDRKYHYIEDTDDKHEIFDLTACSDGGVAFTGEALDLTINGDPDYEYPLQQGWVVKVDSFGCIVPGCQENSISELNSEKTYFKAGPNPLAQGQNLHIYLGNEATGTFSLRDAQGKEIKSFSAQGKNTTYTWELDISSGSYVLSLVDGNKVLQSQKIIIE